MNLRRAIVAVLAGVLTASGATVSAQVIVKSPKEGRPAIWKNATDEATQKAEEAARADAARRLVEAVYLLPVSGDRDVMDMMLKNAQVNKDLIAALGAVKPIGAAEYLEDGTVRVQVRTTPREVVAILKKAYAKIDWDLAEEDAVINAVASRTKATQKVPATGIGALAGSPGEKRLPVRRAALLKAKRAMALKILKMVIREDDNWRDRRYLHEFAKAFPQVPKKMAAGLTTAYIKSETWADDHSVTMRVELNVVKVAEVVRRAQLLYDKRRKWGEWGIPHLVTWTKDMIFKEDPTAAPGDPTCAGGVLVLEQRAVDDAMKTLNTGTPTGGKTKKDKR